MCYVQGYNILPYLEYRNSIIITVLQHHTICKPSFSEKRRCPFCLTIYFTRIKPLYRSTDIKPVILRGGKERSHQQLIRECEHKFIALFLQVLISVLQIMDEPYTMPESFMC